VNAEKLCGFLAPNDAVNAISIFNFDFSFHVHPLADRVRPVTRSRYGGDVKATLMRPAPNGAVLHETRLQDC